MLNGSSYYITSYVYQNMFMWSLMLLPIITLRSMCEDRKNKTDQALLTAPVSVTGIVWGKYLACLSVYLIAMLLCLVPALVIGIFSSPSWASISMSWAPWSILRINAVIVFSCWPQRMR